MLCRFVEFATRGPRRVEASDSEHDLHISGQDPRTSQREGRLSDEPPDSGGGRLRLSLRQPHECQAGLRLASIQARLAVRLLGCFEVASQAMHLSLAIEGVAARQLVQRPSREPFRRATRFDQRTLPIAAEKHDLGAMHQTQPIVGDHFGLTLAPSGQRASPLPHVSHVVRGPAEGDGVAIDDAGHDRRQIVRRRSGQRFVHQPQAFLHPSESHQCACLIVPREPDQIRIPEPLADLGGPQRRGVAILKVAADPSARARRESAGTLARRSHGRNSRATARRERTSRSLGPVRL